MTTTTTNKRDHKMHSRFIAEIYPPRSKPSGEVGLELETIGIRLPVAFQETKLWTVHNDASVRVRRGETALEYVLIQPVSRSKVIPALEELHKEFQLINAEPAEDRLSNSVHVHFNAQKLTMQQVYTWLTLWFIFEDLLVEHAGPDRVGNLFCLRAKDAEFLIRQLVIDAKQDRFGHLAEVDDLKYAAVNVTTLAKYGSLEFRALRGTTNIGVIQEWLELLYCIKDAALKFESPLAVVTDFSYRGPAGLVNYVFTENLLNVIKTKRNWRERMFEGVRIAQDLAYSTKWENYIPKPGEKIPVMREYMDFDELAPVIAARAPRWVPEEGPPVPPPIAPNGGPGDHPSFGMLYGGRVIGDNFMNGIGPFATRHMQDLWNAAQEEVVELTEAAFSRARNRLFDEVRWYENKLCFFRRDVAQQYLLREDFQVI